MGKRPESVPAEAEWNDDDGEWVVGARTADGKKKGAFSYWRKDGTLCCTASYVKGKPHGAYHRYHETGEVSEAGTFKDGELDGLKSWWKSRGKTTERPYEHFAHMQELYENGRVVWTKYFTADGEPCDVRGEVIAKKSRAGKAAASEPTKKPKPDWCRKVGIQAQVAVDDCFESSGPEVVVGAWFDYATTTLLDWKQAQEDAFADFQEESGLEDDAFDRAFAEAWNDGFKAEAKKRAAKLGLQFADD